MAETCNKCNRALRSYSDTVQSQPYSSARWRVTRYSHDPYSTTGCRVLCIKCAGIPPPPKYYGGGGGSNKIAVCCTNHLYCYFNVL